MKYVSRVLLTNFDGTLSILKLDETKLSLAPDNQLKAKIDFGTVVPPFYVELSRFDRCSLMVLGKKICGVRNDAFQRCMLHSQFYHQLHISSLATCTKVYALGSGSPALLAQIKCPIDSGFWTGARFLSAQTILIFSNHGSSYVYYLGPTTNVLNGPLSSVPKEAIILVSDGQTARYVREMKIGPGDGNMCVSAGGYILGGRVLMSCSFSRTATCVGRFDTSNM